MRKINIALLIAVGVVGLVQQTLAIQIQKPASVNLAEVDAEDEVANCNWYNIIDLVLIFIM